MPEMRDRTHSRPEELDGELFAWIKESYDFADAKR